MNGVCPTADGGVIAHSGDDLIVGQPQLLGNGAGGKGGKDDMTSKCGYRETELAVTGVNIAGHALQTHGFNVIRPQIVFIAETVGNFFDFRIVCR